MKLDENTSIVEFFPLLIELFLTSSRSCAAKHNFANNVQTRKKENEFSLHDRTRLDRNFPHFAAKIHELECEKRL